MATWTVVDVAILRWMIPYGEGREAWNFFHAGKMSRSLRSARHYLLLNAVHYTVSNDRLALSGNCFTEAFQELLLEYVRKICIVYAKRVSAKIRFQERPTIQWAQRFGSKLRWSICDFFRIKLLHCWDCLSRSSPTKSDMISPKLRKTLWIFPICTEYVQKDLYGHHCPYCLYNCTTNYFVATELKNGLLGCSYHCLQQSIGDIIAEEAHITQKAHNLMSKFCAVLLRAKLCAHTHIVTCKAEKNWCSFSGLICYRFALGESLFKLYNINIWTRLSFLLYISGWLTCLSESFLLDRFKIIFTYIAHHEKWRRISVPFSTSAYVQNPCYIKIPT